MIWNFLTAVGNESVASSEGSKAATGCLDSLLGSWPILMIVGLLIVFYFVNKRRQKRSEEEANDTLDAIQPGNKIKTIGGICGVVVEVCPDDNTFIVETGSDVSGKSYMKLDRKAVYQTDAKRTQEQPPVEEPVEEKPVEEPVEEAPVEEPFEDISEQTDEK